MLYFLFWFSSLSDGTLDDFQQWDLRPENEARMNNWIVDDRIRIHDFQIETPNHRSRGYRRNSIAKLTDANCLLPAALVTRFHELGVK